MPVDAHAGPGIRRLLLLGFILISAGNIMAADEKLELVDTVDLERYQGRWFEIARLPNRFQNSCDGNVSADYRLKQDGRIEVVNRCRSEHGGFNEVIGEARRPSPEDPARLEVRFAPRWLSWLPLVWGDYQIMALSDDYQWAMVGAPSRKYLWILARRPSLPETRIEALLAEAERQGFDTDELIRTPQAVE
ncbi:MAG: lipocalin family protein [Wenzhouxiangellaceae bacterium]|nr:lipocalin family protein [Wenzhouxiangellaceae bacterium]